MTFTLRNEDKKMLEQALSILAQTYDQHGFDNPENIIRIRDKIKRCSMVQLITRTGRITFADEA